MNFGQLRFFYNLRENRRSGVLPYINRDVLLIFQTIHMKFCLITHLAKLVYAIEL